MIEKGRRFLAKLQTALGTPETGLLGTDFIEPDDSSKLDYAFENDPDETVSGSVDDQNPLIIGAGTTNATLDFKMRSFGPATLPDWAVCLQAAGWVMSSETVGTNLIKYTLVPGVSKDLTLWEYNGGSVIKAGNMMFDWSIEGVINKKCKLSLVGKGIIQSLPALGTAPTITKNGSITPAIFPRNSRVIIGSAVYVPYSFKFEAGNAVEQRISGNSSSYGYGKSEITKRAIKWSASVYTEKQDVLDPYAAMEASTQDDIVFEWGPTGRSIAISSAKAQIGNIERTASGNISAWNLSGICVDNDMSIVINNDITA